MSYAGCCDKYGMRKSFAVAMAAPILLNTAFQIAKAAPVESILLTGVACTFYGFMAFGFSAMASHFVVENILSNKGIGVTRGSKLLRGWQAALYAVPVATGLALNAGADIKLHSQAIEIAYNTDLPTYSLSHGERGRVRGYTI